MNSFDLEHFKSTAEITSTEQSVEVCKPMKTRAICSIYEYVAALTTLARSLQDMSSISKYIDVVKVDSLINPAQLAFELIRQKKQTVTFVRNYHGGDTGERVSLSELYINPEWEHRLENYFADKSKSMDEELYCHLLEELAQ